MTVSWKCSICDLLNPHYNDFCQACFEERQLLNPNLPIYDTNNNAIKTDILVSGYIRQLFNIAMIPSEILHLCFLFWFIDICDQWDKSLIDEYAEIDGSRFKMKENPNPWDIDGCVAFGTHSVEEGEIFQWKLRFNTKMKWIYIGICADEPKLLAMADQDCLLYNSNGTIYHNSSYGFEGDQGCSLLHMNGVIYCGDFQQYCPTFDAKDTIIEVILNMKEHTICYKINGKHYGIAYNNLSKKKYRLAVTLREPMQEIQLM